MHYCYRMWSDVQYACTWKSLCMPCLSTFRAEQLAISSQPNGEDDKENSPAKGRGLLFKRKAARRSKSLSKDHWEDVIFCKFEIILGLACWEKKFFRGHFEIFFLIFPENTLWHFMQIVSLGDNLHEMSKPIFWANKKYHQFVICWICTENVNG